MLNEIDHSLMLLLNFDGGAVTDFLMYWFSYKWTLAPIYALVLVALWRKCANWRQFLLMVLTLALIVTLCDQIASHLIKPWAARLRPSRDPLIMDLLHYVKDYHGGGPYGFASSHAANTSGVGVFLWSVFRQPLARSLVVLWVLLTCYSRIYLGVHFPGDILGGLAVGLATGWIVTTLFWRLKNRLKAK